MPQRSCHKFIEHIRRNAVSGKSSFGKSTVYSSGQADRRALVAGDAVEIYARQSGLEKRPHSLIYGCARSQTWTERELLYSTVGQRLFTCPEQTRPKETNQSRACCSGKGDNLRA